MVLRRMRQESSHSIEQTEPGLLGVLEAHRQWQVWQPFPYLGHDCGDICGTGAHLSTELRDISFSNIRPNNLYPEPVGCGPRTLVATPPESQSAASSGMHHKFPGSAGLADAWLTNEHHQASPTGQRILQRCLQHSHLRLPPYEYLVSKASRYTGLVQLGHRF